MTKARILQIACVLASSVSPEYIICLPATYESGTHHPCHGMLTPATVLGYFKRERAKVTLS